MIRAASTAIFKLSKKTKKSLQLLSEGEKVFIGIFFSRYSKFMLPKLTC